MDKWSSRDAAFTRGTRHTMGSIDRGPAGSPSKPGCIHDGNGTAPRRLCVNRRGCARNSGRQQCDLLRLRWDSLKLLLNALVFPGPKERHYFFICPHLHWCLLASFIGRCYYEKSQPDTMNGNLPYFINDGCWHRVQWMLQNFDYSCTFKCNRVPVAWELALVGRVPHLSHASCKRTFN